MEHAPKLLSDSAIFKLAPKTVAKPSQDIDEDCLDASEANALNLVFAETTIPVPRVRHVVKRQWDYLIVMDYVNGRTLTEVWPTFSIWQKINTALTLRRYVQQLRRLKASSTIPPGPLSAYGPRTCESPIFGQVQSHRGPFASYAELSAFFNERCKMALDANKVPDHHSSRRERFDDSAPLVFTHQDLNPRNIIVGEGGRLWLIDWAWAGYYPPWFEYVAMRRQAENERTIGFNHEFWETFIPFICGPYFKQEEWLWKMSRGLYSR